MKSKYIWWTLYQCNIHNTTFYVLHKVKIHFNNFHWEHVLVFKILTLFTRINDTSRKTNFVPYYTRYYDKYLPLQLTVISYISSQHDFPPVLTHTNVFRPLTSTSPPTPVCHPWSFASLKADSHIACRAHVMLRPCRSPQGHSRTRQSKYGRVRLWSWEERHGRIMAWAWHGKCESETAALCKSNGKDTF